MAGVNVREMIRSVVDKLGGEKATVQRLVEEIQISERRSILSQTWGEHRQMMVGGRIAESNLGQWLTDGALWDMGGLITTTEGRDHGDTYENDPFFYECVDAFDGLVKNDPAIQGQDGLQRVGIRASYERLPKVDGVTPQGKQEISIYPLTDDLTLGRFIEIANVVRDRLNETVGKKYDVTL